MASQVLNSTIAGLSSTASITTVFEEVSKYNVHLNVFERLWAVRSTPILSHEHPTILTRATGLVSLDAE
jgi:hypothetical protein